MKATASQAIHDELRALGIEVQPASPPMALPTSIEAAQTVLELASKRAWRVVPCGQGHRLGALGDVRFDLALSVRALPGEVRFDPGEGVLSAPAGIAWATLQATVAAHGQQLRPDFGSTPANLGESNTVGSVLSLGLSSWDREFGGVLRQRVLGMRVLLADGTLANFGGRLVKNVTGFDLMRLWTGSSGTLGLILEASLRLSPSPVEEHVVWLDVADALRAVQLCDRFRSERIPAASLHWLESKDEGAKLAVWCQGSAGAIADTLRAVRRSNPVLSEASGVEAQSVRRSWAEDFATFTQFPSLLVTCRPSDWSTVLPTLRTALHALGLPYKLHGLPGCAEVRIVWPSESPAAVPGLQTLQDDLEASHATWRWFGVQGFAGTWGPAPSPALAWAQEALRRKFDQKGRFQAQRSEVTP